MKKIGPGGGGASPKFYYVYPQLLLNKFGKYSVLIKFHEQLGWVGGQNKLNFYIEGHDLRKPVSIICLFNL